MAEAAFVHSSALGAYDLGRQHPLRPERVLRAVSLIEAYGLLAEGAYRTVEPRIATRDELLLVHDAEYIDTVERISESGTEWSPRHGIGPGDTPAFKDMHEASALVAGATIAAVEAVTTGSFRRALNLAGGLHHAHRDRAAGFCVYNDCGVAIASALAADPELTVMYLDIDAHHGDGVQQMFYSEPRVLTVSIHEDGRFLYPGTGSVRERGTGAGEGTAINVPLPPLATSACYSMAFDQVVIPAARAFQPSIIVAQCGADAHWADPLTSLGMNLTAFEQLYGRIVVLADDVCDGRLIACGGGGYSYEHVVPRAWAMLAGVLVGVELDEALPDVWLDEISGSSTMPSSLRDDLQPPVSERAEADLLGQTQQVIDKLVMLGIPQH